MKNTTRNILYAKRYTLCAILIALLCLALPQVAQAATYYLDAVNGLDTNLGTSDAPWKTIARAQNYKAGYVPVGYDPMVASGDTVFVKNGGYGTFDEDNSKNPRAKWYIFRTDWITYKATPGHTPTLTGIIIDNEDAWSHTTNGNSYLKFEGFRVLNGVELGFTSYFKVSDCNITGLAESYEGLYAPYFPFNSRAVSSSGGCKYITIEDCDISHTYRGISMVDANDVTIRNNLVHNFAEDGITSSSFNTIIDKNRIYDNNCYRTAMSIDGTGSGTFTAGDALTQAGTNAVGIYASGLYPPTYYIYETSAIHFKTQSNGGGTITGPNGTISNITSWDGPHVDAISLQSYNVSNVSFTNNISIGLEMKLATYNTGVIDNVTISNNLVYYSVPSSDDISMYMATEPVGGSPVAVWTNINFYNNTFYGRKFQVRNSVKIENFYNNILGLLQYEPEKDALIAHHGNNIFTESSGELVKNDTELITSTPGFVNPNVDFNLAPSSVAINFGNPDYGPKTDILGNQRDSQSDAGCYEYVSSTPILSVIYGDINGDGAVTVSDALLAVQSSLELTTLTSDQITKGDVSANGQVTTYDAALILQKIAGIISKFPVE